ncbi:7-cyano-7-deazaguanine synthase [uncultured Tistrella sp.]|uniref:7-cyano-7-deazaguanine synthase n=1 Tax=Tistrella mobilis TaxID=171437 RepID=UPI000C0936C3|nr:7-cyano-7-deazaguanine synthase [uncultured Tistrella sp.]MAM73716.1 7-cyano-7-deazaguanine synthase [Tistrella sp.]|tara:strand:+ start:1231 stop:1851 length:621 start_codon:yes stop_codon:yes gene_type:complete
MKKAVVMVSGGLDSTTVCYLLTKMDIKIQPIFFDYGQHCVEIEWKNVNELLPPEVLRPERLNISDIFIGSRSRMIREADLWRESVSDDDLYLPYRTMLFFAVAAARAQTLGILDVYSGFINSNHAKEIDCSTEFMNGLDELSRGVGAVRFHAPFRKNTKADVIRRALELNVPIGRTFSCQASSSFPCGACPNCVERLKALAEASTV